jgi:hypothetical protein
MKLEKIKSKHSQMIEKADAWAVKAIEPELHKVCDRYGVEFCSGMGSWTFYFAGNPEQAMFRSDAEYFIDVVEPELCSKLWINIDQGNTLGSITPSYCPSKINQANTLGTITRSYNSSAFCNLILVGNEDPCDVYCSELKIELVGTEVGKNESVFGLVCLETANIIKAKYEKDWEDGAQLLICLPSISLEEYKKICEKIV